VTGRSPAATLRLAAWCAGLALCCRALLWLGADTLSIPFTSPRDLPAWATETPPTVMAMALLRAAGIVACAHLLAVTVAGVLARVLRRRALAEVIERATPAVARRLVVGGSSAGLLVGALAGSVPLPLAEAPRSTVATDTAPAATGDRATMVAEARPTGRPAGAVTTASMTGLPAAGATTLGHDPATATSSATMTGVAEPADATGAPGRPGRATPEVTAGSAAPPLPTLDPAVWEVAPGDSLWAIAEDVVRTDAPTAGDRDVTAYWRRLVAANRRTLVDPGNPDLLVPGQRLALPPVGAA
jgi:hypothetical protein